MAGEGIKDGGPAFPRIAGVELSSSKYSGNPPDVYVETDDGMSLRDWFAGQALAGYRSHKFQYDVGDEENRVAQWAYKDADAMLKAREK